MKKLVYSIAFCSALSLLPATAGAQLGDRILKEGMRNSDVQQLQEALKDRGYFKGNTTTYFGKITKSAVYRFEKANKLPADGIAGQTVFRLLKESAPVTNTGRLGDLTLRQGMRHGDVKLLQEALKKRGYFKGNTTTYFGPLTRNAVIRFQKANGLTVDGIAGRNTFHALNASKETPQATGKEQNATFSNTQKLVNFAKQYNGTPYKWGGITPTGFDCSGYLNYVYENAAGVKLPRTVAAIYQYGIKVNKPQIGDLVFFETYKKGPSHAGIYIGNNKFIHSSSSKGVSISSMGNAYWAKRYLGSKKIV